MQQLYAHTDSLLDSISQSNNADVATELVGTLSYGDVEQADGQTSMHAEQRTSGVPPRNPKSEKKPSAFNLGASNIQQVRAIKQVMKTQNVALGNMLQEPRRELSSNSKARQSGKSNGSEYHSRESRSAGGSIAGAGRNQKLLSSKQVSTQMIQTPM